MVEARVHNYSVESATMYNTLVATELERGVDGNDSDGDGNDSVDLEVEVCADIIEYQYKFKIAQKRWTFLYDRDGAENLKNAMMRHLYCQKFGHEAMLMA